MTMKNNDERFMSMIIYRLRMGGFGVESPAMHIHDAALEIIEQEWIYRDDFERASNLADQVMVAVLNP